MANNAAGNSRRNDGKRLQAFTTFQELSSKGLDCDKLCKSLGFMTKEHTLDEPSFLHSLVGVADQREHFDYQKVDFGGDVRRIPLSCILSMDPFWLKVWPGAFQGLSNHDVHTYRHVEPGQLLVFRADLKHAGGHGVGDRLHFFVDNPSLVNGVHPKGETVQAWDL